MMSSGDSAFRTALSFYSSEFHFLSYSEMWIQFSRHVGFHKPTVLLPILNKTNSSKAPNVDRYGVWLWSMITEYDAIMFSED